MAINVSSNTSVAIHIDLSQAVATRLQAFSDDRSLVEARAEAAFQTAVADNTLSPDAQVTYRQAMLDKANAQAVPDQAYITDLEGKLASAKSQAHTSDVTTQINSDKAASQAGLESNQTYLEQLQGMIATENDPSLLANLQSEVASTQNAILNAKLTLIQNEASKGTTDKSTTELNLALSDAQNEKAAALAAGDTARASSMDVTISGINQQLVDINIDYVNNGLNINKLVQSNPLQYLQELQQQIATANSTTPIVYQGVGSLKSIAYPSEQAYWQSVLSNYLTTTFTSDLQKQYDAYVSNSAVVNKLIPASVLNTVQSDFQQLAANPALASAATQIQQIGVQVMGAAVAKNAAAIVDDYGVNNDANAALTQLNTLSQTYGIDVTSYANQVTSGAAKQNSAEINAFNAAVSQYEAQGMSPSDALAQATSDLKSGNGAVIPESNQQLASETPLQAVTPPANASSVANTPPIASSTPTPSNENPNPAQLANEQAPSPGIASGETTPPSSTNVPGQSGSQSLQMPSSSPSFTKFVKTANSPTVYGVTATGQYVGFENEDQLKQSGGTDSNISTVANAPTDSINFSNYKPGPNQPTN